MYFVLHFAFILCLRKLLCMTDVKTNKHLLLVASNSIPAKWLVSLLLTFLIIHVIPYMKFCQIYIDHILHTTSLWKNSYVAIIILIVLYKAIVIQNIPSKVLLLCPWKGIYIYTFVAFIWHFSNLADHLQLFLSWIHIDGHLTVTT